MGRRSKTGGVAPKGDRIEFTFVYAGKRRRPTIDQAPTQTNLRNAARRLKEIKREIKDGTFSFADEFPDYRFIDDIADAGGQRTVDGVCKAFVTSLRARDELAFATVESYRKILKRHIQADHGTKAFAGITFSSLEEVVNKIGGTKKTFNNVVSAVRQAWDYGYKDLPKKPNPALGLSGVRIPKREQPKPDPFSIDDAEARIAKTLELWGEDQADYEEFRFFSGVRPSEEIALIWPDFDQSRGELEVSKARVMAHDKDEPKNYEPRTIELCPRALAVILRRRARWSRLKLEGRVDHEHIFFREDGKPFNDLQVQWKRWRRTTLALRTRERDPYAARHSSVSWNLMIGKNLLWVAEQHGHSAAVMLKAYAKWMKGSTPEDVERIKAAMGFATNLPLRQVANDPNSLAPIGNVLAEREGFEPSSGVQPIKGLEQKRSDGVLSDTLESPDLPPDLPLARRKPR